eukprot:CAMPEP_0171122290 /NCGR_PEP_ID=MMETSP0766_2-20121228/104707_1 /TAXON_ID=439317 /ORGANISM="Gambierdiscus australes, Strain CAWD 149" /LENGTH=236 /DNA_ID=CAMNT_0011585123 /DNA_START=9 /DNA_END=715 /DNA_ORIENTATION=+
MSSLKEAFEMNERIGWALVALAGWLDTEGVTLKAYKNTRDLSEAIRNGAHVLMQCDANFPDERLAPLLGVGGLHLHMTQATGEFLEAWRKPRLPDGCGYVDTERSEHALLDGLALVERRGGVQIACSPAGAFSRHAQLARAKRRVEALSAGALMRVVGEGFPEQWCTGGIGACRSPKKGSGITGMHFKGAELILNLRTETKNAWGTWFQLARQQLDGAADGGKPGWILQEPRMLGG